MRHQCPGCSHRWTWRFSDGRLKGRRCGQRDTARAVWDQYRLRGVATRQLIEYFVLGVPVYRLRFRGPATRPTRERYFRLIQAVPAGHEPCRDPLTGAIECDEPMFGGHRAGRRGWGAAGNIIVLGIWQRHGVVRVFPVQGRGARRLRPLIRQATTPGSL